MRRLIICFVCLQSDDYANVKSWKKVKLNYTSGNKTILISEWLQSGYPSEKSNLKFELTKEEDKDKTKQNQSRKDINLDDTKKLSLNVTNLKSGISYHGSLQIPNSMRYFVGVQEGNINCFQL